jgi:hypothetical protein
MLFGHASEHLRSKALRLVRHKLEYAETGESLFVSSPIHQRAHYPCSRVPRSEQQMSNFVCYDTCQKLTFGGASEFSDLFYSVKEDERVRAPFSCGAERGEPEAASVSS